MFKYGESQPWLTLNGSTEFEQFATSFDIAHVTQTDNDNNGNDKRQLVLAVSSPFANAQRSDTELGVELKLAGVVKVFTLDDENGQGQARLVSVLKSDRAYAQFGKQTKFDDDGFLYVSAPLWSLDPLRLTTHVHNGVVYRFSPKAFMTNSTDDNCDLLDPLIPCPQKQVRALFATILFLS